MELLCHDGIDMSMLAVLGDRWWGCYVWLKDWEVLEGKLKAPYIGDNVGYDVQKLEVWNGSETKMCCLHGMGFAGSLVFLDVMYLVELMLEVVAMCIEWASSGRWCGSAWGQMVWVLYLVDGLAGVGRGA